jgi:hypothetical protein
MQRLSIAPAFQIRWYRKWLGVFAKGFQVGDVVGFFSITFIRCRELEFSTSLS